MAYINQYYVFVDSDGETVNRSVTISDHPVEEGMVITDNVKSEPLEIRISGKLAGSDSETVKSGLESLMRHGSFVRYIGKEILSNAVITAMSVSRSVSLSGGMEVELTLREIRVARSAYRSLTASRTMKSGTQQIVRNNNKVYHTVKNGDTLYDLALKYYGSDSGYVKLYEANSDTIENAAHNSGYTSSEGGHVLIPGIQILIP